MIMDKIFGLERIEFEKLDKIHVEEVMLTDIPRLKIDDPILKGFGLVINNAFVCVESFNTTRLVKMPSKTCSSFSTHTNALLMTSPNPFKIGSSIFKRGMSVSMTSSSRFDENRIYRDPCT